LLLLLLLLLPLTLLPLPLLVPPLLLLLLLLLRVRLSLQLISGKLPPHITLAEGPTPPGANSSSSLSSSLSQPLAERLRGIWQGWLSCRKTPRAIEQER
jgi:hypothetical protein